MAESHHTGVMPFALGICWGCSHEQGGSGGDKGVGLADPAQAHSQALHADHIPPSAWPQPAMLL